MCKKALVLLALTCTLLVGGTTASMSIWTPANNAIIFHGDIAEISWVCSDSDSPSSACASGSFTLELWQKTGLISNRFSGTVGPGNVHGIVLWEVPINVTEGDQYYFYATNKTHLLGSSSFYFKIRASGFHIHSPSAGTAWVPGVNVLVDWTSSRYFQALNSAVIASAVQVENEKVQFKIGSALAGSGRLVLSSDSTIPWDEIKNDKYYIKIESTNGSAVGQSKHFLISRNGSVVCDSFSLAAGFAKEAYGELRTWRNYRTCGMDWQTIYSYRLGDQAALAVVNHASKMVIFSFRGTVMAISDWIHDLAVTQVACESYLAHGCGGGFVHSGFAWAFNFTRQDFRDLTAHYLPLGYEIVLTGHSKGGAIANLQAVDLMQLYSQSSDGKQYMDRFRLVTFGSPRVGDAKFASTVDALLSPKLNPCRHARFVTVSRYCGADPVTGLPPRGYYDHAGREVTVDCSLSCTKRAPMGVAAGCHILTKYIEAVSVHLQGHAQC